MVSRRIEEEEDEFKPPPPGFGEVDESTRASLPQEFIRGAQQQEERKESEASSGWGSLKRRGTAWSFIPTSTAISELLDKGRFPTGAEFRRRINEEVDIIQKRRDLTQEEKAKRAEKAKKSRDTRNTAFWASLNNKRAGYTLSEFSSDVEKVLKADEISSLFGFITRMGLIKDWGMDKTTRIYYYKLSSETDPLKYKSDLGLLRRLTKGTSLYYNMIWPSLQAFQKLNRGLATYIKTPEVDRVASTRMDKAAANYIKNKVKRIGKWDEAAQQNRDQEILNRAMIKKIEKIQENKSMKNLLGF